MRAFPCSNATQSRVYVMSFEVCGLPQQYNCAVHMRTSADGWDWGDPSDIGTFVSFPDSSFFAHTPVIAAVDEVILLIGQIYLYGNGTQVPTSGGVLFSSSVTPQCQVSGQWAGHTSPVNVPWPPTQPENYCPNYSPALIVAGNTVLEVSTAYVGQTCCAFYNSSSIW